VTSLLLVGLDQHEQAALERCPVPATTVDPERLELAMGEDAAAVVVVGGSDPASAVAVVQRVHRCVRELPVTVVVAVLVRSSREDDLRRHVQFAADVPADLELLQVDDVALPRRVVDLCEAADLRQVHDRAVAEIGARQSERSGQTPFVRASLGTLLEQAPLGVVVADLEHRVLATNRMAAELLGLDHDVAGEHLPALFGDRSLVARLVAAASTVGASDPWPEETTQGMRGHLDVSAARTRLDDGREVVMLLVGDASARTTAEQARDLLSDRVAMMGRVSEGLLGTQDPEEVLRLIAQEVVPTLGDWVSVQLYDERGQTRRVVARHSDPGLAAMTALVERELPTAVSENSPSRRLARGEPPMLLENITTETLTSFISDPEVLTVLTDIGVRSAIAVPLDGRQTRVGSMVLINRDSSAPFGEQELAIALEVGRRIGIALETLHLYTRQRALAEELQRSMLTEPPDPDDAEIEVRYLPASHEAQVGGDWYDAYLQPDGSIVLTIGDVVGHDYRAAAAMGQLRGLLRGIGYARESEPGQMLRSLDSAVQGLLPGITATAVVARVTGLADRARGAAPALLHWSNAGHPPPILVPVTGEPVVLASETPDVLLGVVPTFVRTEMQTAIHEGDTLVLYSDGLIERRGRDFDEGVTALVDALRDGAGLPLPALCDHLLARLVQDEHDDDVALVALRLRAPVSPAR
jgi:PAS domain S-box-containing protein